MGAASDRGHIGVAWKDRVEDLGQRGRCVGGGAL
jgi:hypothetical protein